MVSRLLHVRPCLLISLDLEFLAQWIWSSCPAKLTSPIRSRKGIAPQAKMVGARRRFPVPRRTHKSEVIGKSGIGQANVCHSSVSLLAQVSCFPHLVQLLRISFGSRLYLCVHQKIHHHVWRGYKQPKCEWPTKPVQTN